MIAAQREDTPASEQIQVTPALGIEEPRAFSAHIVFIETDGAQHLHERGVEMAFVQLIPAALLGFKPLWESLVHKNKRFIKTIT